MTNNLKA